MVDNNVLSSADRIAAEQIRVTTQGVPKGAVPRGEFEAALRRNLTGMDNQIEFSSHAIDRLQKRNLSMSPEQLARLTGAVSKASEKGAKESLILLDNMAMIVSIANKKVITAMDVDGMKDNVITNIDSAIIT